MGMTSEASQACQAGGGPTFLGFMRASHAPEEETVVSATLVSQRREFGVGARARRTAQSLYLC